MTCIGTMQLNRKGIPDELRKLKTTSYYLQRFIGMKIALFQYRHTLSKHLKVKKNVIFLSTTSPILDITKDDGKSKLGIYKVYDFTKGGIDKPKSRKWTITVFSYVIDIDMLLILVNRILLNIATLYYIS